MKTQKKWNVTLFGGALLLLGADLKATTTFSELEADVYLSCGGSGLCDANDMSMGDFDGDGFDDLIYDSNYSGVPNFVVFGDNFPAGGGFPSIRTTRVGSGISEPSDIWQIGDITGDRRADLFHFVSR